MFFNGYKRAVDFAGTYVLVTLRIPYDDAHLAVADSASRPSHMTIASRSRSIFVENIENIGLDDEGKGQALHSDLCRAFSAYNDSDKVPFERRFVYWKNRLVNLQQRRASALNVKNGPIDSYVFFYLSKEAALGDVRAAATIDQAPYRAILAKAHRTPPTSEYSSKYKRDRPVRERRAVKRMKL